MEETQCEHRTMPRTVGWRGSHQCTRKAAYAVHVRYANRRRIRIENLCTFHTNQAPNVEAVRKLR